METPLCPEPLVGVRVDSLTVGDGAGEEVMPPPIGNRPPGQTLSRRSSSLLLRIRKLLLISETPRAGPLCPGSLRGPRRPCTLMLPWAELRT